MNNLSTLQYIIWQFVKSPHLKKSAHVCQSSPYSSNFPSPPISLILSSPWWKPVMYPLSKASNLNNSRSFLHLMTVYIYLNLFFIPYKHYEGSKYADWNLFWIYLDKLFWILLGSFLFYNIGFWQHEYFSNHSKFHFLWLRQQYFGGFHLNF